MNWTLIWAAVTPIATVFVGLALPLAFVQLGALRQDRLRAQVAKVGGWTGAPEREGDEAYSWSIPVWAAMAVNRPSGVDALDLTASYGRQLASRFPTTLSKSERQGPA